MVLAFLGYHLLSIATLGYGLQGDVSPLNVAANLVMLHEFVPFSAVNPPSWSMAPELGAYLAFPLLAPLLIRVRGPLTALLLLGGLLTVGVAVLSARYAAHRALRRAAPNPESAPATPSAADSLTA